MGHLRQLCGTLEAVMWDTWGTEVGLGRNRVGHSRLAGAKFCFAFRWATSTQLLKSENSNTP